MDSEYTFKSVTMSYGCICTVEINARNEKMRLASSRGFGHESCSHHSGDVGA